MEVLVILFGILFWPVAIIAWFLYIRKQKPPKLFRYAGTLFIVTMPLLAAISMGKYMLLDEPLVIAAKEGDVVKVRSLLAMGADPDASFKGNPALEQAAAEGHQEIVHLLLSHGAWPDTRNDWSKQTALESAKKNGHAEVVNMLKQAQAPR
ncbi:MAG TPA: ankyrin repeat domain-containing protein [Chthonomonadaceae bacterium]|nr:ankyrin repeat domain-containing protein [Chthonomonadaceae bacterium]